MTSTPQKRTSAPNEPRGQAGPRHYRPRLSAVLCLGMLALAVNAAANVESIRESGFTALWWVDGPPGYLTMNAQPPRPVLAVRSAEIGLLIDTRSLRLLHAGRFSTVCSKDVALTAGTQPLLELPPAELSITVVRDGKTFVCQGRAPAPKDEFFQPVRFVETGRWFQRVQIAALEFATADGTKLPEGGTLEIALWPDRLSLAVTLDHRGGNADGELSIAAAGQRASVSLQNSRHVGLPLFSREPEPPGARVETDASLALSFDPALGCFVARLPEQPWSNAKGTYYPEEHLDRLDRWPLTLRNDSKREAVVRLMFVQENNLPITGFTPMLCDPDGTPTGVPVQISKNWHQRPEKGHLEHEGPWFHGCVFLRLPAQSRREFVFQMVYARYGGVPAASHAQLSLVGWGHNQFWDEAALGSFGESICYEPGRVQRRAFVTDIRPLLTLPAAGGKPWGWAENCGGGDFLVWFDENGAYRGFRGTRTDYRAQGPCRTDVRYREETARGEIQAVMDVSITRSDDYLRAFHHVRYDIKQHVQWKRFAFLQLGADFYNDSPARRVAIGNTEGLREEWAPARAPDAYDRRALPLTGRQAWASIHGLDRAALGQGGAVASRGLIVRAWKAQFNGKPSLVPHLWTYANEWGRGNHRTALELGPPPDVTSLQPGDYVEAEVELVVFPGDAKAYYGPNRPFREALTANPDSWQLVHREASGNNVRVDAQRGALTQTYPLVLAADHAETAVASVQGGVGWLPVTVTGLRRHREYQLRVDGQPFSQAVHGNDYWQTDYDPETGSWSQTFNLRRNDSSPLRLEFGPLPAPATKTAEKL